MVYHLLIVFIALILLMSLWWLVQRLVRQNNPELRDDCDILEERGCSSCSENSGCNRPEKR